MNIRGTIVGVIAGTIVGGASLTGSQATEAPNLACDTAEDCQVVIDRMYGDLKDVSAEVNDLRKIRRQQDRQILRLKETVQRLRDRRG